MHARLLTALLIALVVLLGSCSDDGETDAVDGSEDAAASQDATEGGPEAPEALELEDPPDFGDPVDLADGVAATVDGVEIATTTVEERFDAVAALPEAAEQLEGEEGDAAAEMIRGRILDHLIFQQLVAHGAQDLGVEPSAEEVLAVEEQAIEEFEGDEEEYRAALDAEGITDEQRDAEFRYLARIEAIRDAVAGDLDEEAADEGGELGMQPADMALQQWVGERLAAADIQVDQQYGLWSPQAGQVIPPMALEASE